MPLPTNYDGSTFFTPLNIGLVNGKGMDENKKGLLFMLCFKKTFEKKRIKKDFVYG